METCVLCLDNCRIGVIGLGYVGLPLAVEFGKTRQVVGYDTNSGRIEALLAGRDMTLEVSGAELQSATRLNVSAALDALRDCNIFIVTVPTPIDSHRQPDLNPLRKASHDVGTLLKKGDVVVFESTVYPGATEEVCVPLLEEFSGLKFNEGFFVGYSPERINPGDKTHRLPDIMKVTAGSTPETLDLVDSLYKTIIVAGTHRAPSIKVAEAAKVIENTQRDLNIALVNELAVIFNLLDIDTHAVLEAAGTKWNFLPFKPGLVGGHCIGVDPYYLTYKAQSVGYHPEIILAGRRLNDGMGAYVAHQLVKAMIKRRVHVQDARILVLGLTFKENCPDLRNTRVIDVISELNSYGCVVEVYDPWADKDVAEDEYGLSLLDMPSTAEYDAVLIAVAHDDFREMGIDQARSFLRPDGLIYDLKGLFSRDLIDASL